MMLKAIHAQENKEAAREKARSIGDKLKEMKLSSAAKKVQEGIEETLTYMDFPTQHWTRSRTNNTIERLNREDQTPDKGDRCVSGRSERFDAGMCQTAPCSRDPMGNPSLHEYGSSLQTGGGTAV